MLTMLVSMSLHGRRRCCVFLGILAVAAAGSGNVVAHELCGLLDMSCFSIAKQTVALTAARRYETATFYETDDEDASDPPVPRSASTDELAALAAIPGVARVLTEPLLERFGVVLLELTDGAMPSVVRARVHATPALSGADAGGSPVYSAGNVHQILVNEVLVKFVDRDLEKHRAVISGVGASVVTDTDLGEHVYMISLPGKGGGHARLASNALDRRRDVAYAQPNFITFADRADATASVGLTHESMCPVDHCPSGGSAKGTQQYLAGRWYLNDPVAADGRSTAGINARRAWDVTRGNPEIVVAIIDDGVDGGHPALHGRIHSTWNAHTESADLALHDFDRHGTAVAGLVAAVAPDVKLMPVRVFQWSSSGMAYFPRHVIARGIRQAAESAHVLTMGWALGRQPDADPIIDDALDFALRKGRVLVLAAGNGGGRVAYPARLSAVKPIIAVAAMDERNERKVRSSASCDWGSNFGPEIDVAAPGTHLLTLDRPGRQGYCAAGDYTSSFGGTSGAAALVAGTAALVLSVEPHLSPQDVRDRLRSTASDLGEPGIDSSFGHGKIDACRALLTQSCGRSDRPD